MVTNHSIYGLQCLRDEAEALLALRQYVGEDFNRAVELILACHGKVIVTGVGKSGHIGAKIAATFASTGTPSFFINPLDIFHGDLGALTNEDLLLAISNSGQTDELLRFIPLMEKRQVPIIGMSGNENSLLAKYSTVHLCTKVEREACPLGLAPTSSTTAQLAMGDALACALIVARNFRAQDFARFHPGGTLGKRLLTRAHDVMQTEALPVVSPEMPMGEVVCHVSSGRLGLVVITDEANKVEGIITDGDVRRAMEHNQARFFDLRATDIMTKTPQMVAPETKIAEIEHIMRERKIHSVLVVDSQQHLLGIVDSFRTML